MTAQDKPNDPLAGRLASDAQRLSPSYSEQLHQRTMQAIRAGQTRMIIRSHSAWHHAAIAAAAVVLLSLCAWYFAGDKTSPPPNIAHGVGADLSIPDASDLLRHGSQPLQEALSGIDGNGLAQFEIDARSLARYFANQFPQSDPRSSARPSQPKPQPGT